MNEQKKSLRGKAILFFAVSLGLALVTTTLRTVNLLFFFDTELGYYTHGAWLPVVEWICLGVSAALILTGAILLFRKQSIGYAKKAPMAVRIGSILGALGFGVLLYSDAMSYVSAQKLGETSLTTGIIPILLSLGAFVYFGVIALDRQAEALRLLTGFCAILRLVTAMSASYFNFLVPMNAPGKLMLQLGILGAMLFLVNEIRAFVSTPRSVLYMISAGVATILLGAASVPSLLAFYFSKLTDNSLVPVTVALLGLFFYVTLRFLFVCLSPDPMETDSAESEDPAEEATAPETHDAPTESEENQQ